MQIVRDLAIGKDGEISVVNLLNNASILAKLNEDKAVRSYYDIVAILDREFTIEVKNDIYAARSGNIAIEIYNPKSEKLSGLCATKSDIWVHIVGGRHWFTATALLKTFVNIHKPKRIIDKAGDGNATIYLYDVDIILPAIFVCMDGKEKKDLQAEIKTLLKHNGV